MSKLFSQNYVFQFRLVFQRTMDRFLRIFVMFHHDNSSSNSTWIAIEFLEEKLQQKYLSNRTSILFPCLLLCVTFGYILIKKRKISVSFLCQTLMRLWKHVFHLFEKYEGLKYLIFGKLVLKVHSSQRKQLRTLINKDRPIIQFRFRLKNSVLQKNHFRRKCWITFGPKLSIFQKCYFFLREFSASFIDLSCLASKNTQIIYSYELYCL